MRGLIWEIKSPTNCSANSISRLFYRAVRQSPNIIFDLRRLKTKKTFVQLEKLFHNSRQVKNLLLIAPDAKLYTYHKK